MGRVGKLLTSVRLTAALLVLLAVFFLLGLLVPQVDLVGPEIYRDWQASYPTLVAALEGLQLTRVYTSWPMATVWVLFFLNLTAVLYTRLPGIVRRCRVPEPPSSADTLRAAAPTATLTENRLPELARLLQRNRYSVVCTDRSLAAVRNRFAPVGTLLFHLAFILLLAGGLAASVTRFRAEADVAAGETFSGAYTQILAKPRVGGIPAATFTVDAVRATYYDRTIPTSLEVEIRGENGKTVAAINRPYSTGNLSFLVNDIDVAPLFTFVDAAGREIDGAFVKLKVLRGHPDTFAMAGYTMHVRFLTDADGEQTASDLRATLPQALKQTASEGARQNPEVVSPACQVEVERDGKIVAAGLLRPGGSISFDDRRLVFADWVYWVHFYVRSERGLALIFATFALMTAALLLRFGLYRRQIVAVVDAGTTHIAGTAEYFPLLFREEFARIVAGVEEKDKR